MADQVLQSISVNILSMGVAESQTGLIACTPEGDRVLVDLTRCIEVICGENSDRDLAFAFGVDTVGVASRFDNNCYNDGLYCSSIVTYDLLWAERTVIECDLHLDSR